MWAYQSPSRFKSFTKLSRFQAFKFCKVWAYQSPSRCRLIKASGLGLTFKAYTRGVLSRFTLGAYSQGLHSGLTFNSCVQDLSSRLTLRAYAPGLHSRFTPKAYARDLRSRFSWPSYSYGHKSYTSHSTLNYITYWVNVIICTIKVHTGYYQDKLLKHVIMRDHFSTW